MNDFKNDIVLWKPNEELINECKRIMNERYCENYITIISLESFSNQTNEANAADRLLVCGTFANKPQCNWRNKHKISELIDSFDGIGKSPPSPDLNSIYLKLSNGDYYFATSIDYSEFGMKLDHLIDRSMGPSRQLRTDRYNSNWLNGKNHNFHICLIIYYKNQNFSIYRTSFCGFNSNWKLCLLFHTRNLD